MKVNSRNEVITKPSSGYTSGIPTVVEMALQESDKPMKQTRTVDALRVHVDDTQNGSCSKCFFFQNAGSMYYSSTCHALDWGLRIYLSKIAQSTEIQINFKYGKSP